MPANNSSFVLTYNNDMPDENLTFSASKLKLIDDCFGKYHFKYILKAKVSETIWPGTIRGTILHKLLEESINLKLEGNDNDSILEYVKGKFKLYFDEGKADKSKGIFKASRDYKYDEFVAKGEKASLKFVNFVINYFNDIDKFYPELNLTLPYEFVPGINLKGIMDLPYINKEGIIRIGDFKTTKESDKWYFVLFAEDIQKLCYFYLAWKHFGSMPQGFDYLIYNIEEKNIFFQSVTYLEIDDVEKFFKPLTDRIKILKKLHLKPDIKYYNPSKEGCKWCDFAKICPRAIK